MPLGGVGLGANLAVVLGVWQTRIGSSRRVPSCRTRNQHERLLSTSAVPGILVSEPRSIKPVESEYCISSPLKSCVQSKVD